LNIKIYFSDATTRVLLDRHRCFGETWCFHLQDRRDMAWRRTQFSSENKRCRF